METRVRTTITSAALVRDCPFPAVVSGDPSHGATVIKRRCLFETRRAMRTMLHPKVLNNAGVEFVPSYLRSKSGGQLKKKRQSLATPKGSKSSRLVLDSPISGHNAR